MTTNIQTKCLTCIHVPVCVNNLGGADLDVVGADCTHFLPTYYQPVLKFWVIFDVPGFYDIIEYEATEATYRQGRLVSVEGMVHRNSYGSFSDRDFGKTVFFSKYEAEKVLEKLIKDRRNEERV